MANRSIDYEPSTVPSTFVLPSSHKELDTPSNHIDEGDFLFVLRDTTALNGGGTTVKYGDNYKTRYNRLGKDEVPLVTIQKLNELLIKAAQADYVRGEAVKGELGDTIEVTAEELNWEGNKPSTRFKRLPIECVFPWYASPRAVAEWAEPFGVALNSMQLNRWGGGGDPANPAAKSSWRGHNVVVSRRASVKNNFFSCAGNKGSLKWHSQSLQHVGIQYNLEMVKMEEHDPKLRPVVQVSMLALTDLSLCEGCPMYDSDPDGMIYVGPSDEGFVTDCYAEKCNFESSGCCRAYSQPDRNGSTVVPNEWKLLKQSEEVKAVEKLATCIQIDGHNKGVGPRPTAEAYDIWGGRPLGDPSTRVIIPIGRVLHSPPRCPTAKECLESCYAKDAYDRLKPVEVELGCN